MKLVEPVHFGWSAVTVVQQSKRSSDHSSETNSWIPEGYTIQGQDRETADPWLSVTVALRRVKWKTGKFAYIKEILQEDGTQKLVFDHTRIKEYKSAVTVSKIIVLIRTKSSDEEPEILRASSVRQGYIGAEMRKEDGGMSVTVELVMRQHPDRKKHIRSCMTKWHERTSGKSHWVTRTHLRWKAFSMKWRPI